MTTETNLQEASEQPVSNQSKNSKSLPVFTIINALLFVGLVVLYVLFFTRSDQVDDQKEQLTQIEKQISGSVSSIAYVDSDVLLEEYELAIIMRVEFEEEQRRLERDLTRRQQTFQNDVEGFQRSINAGTISLDRAQEREQELMLMQQELMQLNDTYRERLAIKEFEMNVELLEKISDFLERYNKEAGHDFILGYSRGGGILFADQSHDITQTVLRLLNAEYLESE